MSKSYLYNLSDLGLNELKQQLHIHQFEKCFICGSHITNPLIETSIISLKNHKKFKIEDYALCHKTCDIDSVRNDIFRKAIENFEFVSGISVSFEQLDTDVIETDYNTNYTNCFGKLEIQTHKKIGQDEFWQKEDKIHKAITYYEKAKEHKRNKKYKLAITALEKAITLLHNIEQTSYPEIHSCLIDCYAKIKDIKNQVRVIKLAIELYSDSKYTKMLNRINGTEKDCLLNKDSYQVVAKCNYGEAYDNHVKKHLPEFNFYYNNFNPFSHYNFEREDMLPIIRKIDSYFQHLLKQAEKAEHNETYENAVELYEQLIAEGCFSTKPYERLTILYSKANRINDTIRILQNGIRFFEKRKDEQAKYVRDLAKKYSAENYCEMCIRTNKKIHYYCGNIILYQDYPCLNKWRSKLLKLIK